MSNLVYILIPVGSFVLSVCLVAGIYLLIKTLLKQYIIKMIEQEIHAKLGIQLKIVDGWEYPDWQVKITYNGDEVCSDKETYQ